MVSKKQSSKFLGQAISQFCSVHELKHVATMASFSKPEIHSILRLARNMKSRPQDYRKVMEYKTLLMLF
eukprot:TRINITY_DN1032_c1_g1_i1.p1 TRINITY_DN1032_c1_g1~~TRINITY_DN1032_c1_g1_i1.p1  ORF type:complete len:69 (-),score=2.79 TRINITY_DN1032_c1_g1_i1:74-280(-)